jgi:hypothetical protein
MLFVAFIVYYCFAFYIFDDASTTLRGLLASIVALLTLIVNYNIGIEFAFPCLLCVNCVKQYYDTTRRSYTRIQPIVIPAIESPQLQPVENVQTLNVSVPPSERVSEHPLKMSKRSEINIASFIAESIAAYKKTGQLTEAVLRDMYITGKEEIDKHPSLLIYIRGEVHKCRLSVSSGVKSTSGQFVVPFSKSAIEWLGM